MVSFLPVSRNFFFRFLLMVVFFSSFYFNSFSDDLNWTQVTASASWKARYGHISLSFDGNLWISGGQNSSRLNDVWTSSDGNNWVLRDNNAEWTARSYFSSVVFDNNLWVLSGFDGSNNFNDVWTSSDGNNWVLRDNNAEWSKRYGHSSVVFDGNLWVLGGFVTSSSSYLNDVWTSSDGNNWVSRDNNAEWNARAFYSSVVFDGNLWVLGGYSTSPSSYLNDVWTSSDGNNWVRKTDSAGWSARGEYSSVVFDGKIWVLGGYDETVGYLNDTWYSSNGVTWTQATNNTVFPARAAHSSVVFNKNSTDVNKIWVAGGYSSAGDTNDVWRSSFLNPPSVDINSPVNGSTTSSIGVSFIWIGSTLPSISRYYVSVNGGALTPFGLDTIYNYALPSGTSLPFTVDFNVVAESDISDANASDSVRVVFSSSSSLPSPSTCSTLGGVVCSADAYCSGSLVFSADAPECCLDWCILIEPPLWAPDLLPEDFDVVESGDYLDFSVSVFNYSMTDVDDFFNVNFYSGNIETDSSAVLLRSFSVPILYAYDSESLGFSVLKSDLPAGYGLFSVVVDSDNRVDELDEFNNFSSLDFFGPDLVADGFDIVGDANGLLKFSVSVLNDSDVDVLNSFDVGLYSGDVKFDSSSVLLDSGVVGGLSSRGLKSFVFSVPKKDFSFDRGFSVFVDSNEFVLESDEFNNFGFIDLNKVSDFTTGKNTTSETPVIVSGSKSYKVSFFPELFLNSFQRFVVFGSDGKLVSNVLVKVDGFVSGLTGLDGVFVFKVVRDGKFDFGVFVGDDRVFSSFFKVKDLLIVFDRGVVFVGEFLNLKVVDSVDLLPVEGARINVLFPSGDILEFVTGEGGEFEFAVSEVGEYTVSAMKSNVKSSRVFSVVEPSFFTILSSLFSDLVLLLSSRELMPILVPLLLFLCLAAAFLAFRALGLYFLILYEGGISSSFERKLLFSRFVFSLIVFVLPWLFSLLWIFGIGILVALSEVIVFALFYSTEKKILKRKFNR